MSLLADDDQPAPPTLVTIQTPGLVVTSVTRYSPNVLRSVLAFLIIGLVAPDMLLKILRDLDTVSAPKDERKDLVVHMDLDDFPDTVAVIACRMHASFFVHQEPFPPVDETWLRFSLIA